MLENNEFYMKVPNDPYKNTWKQYIKLLKEHPNELTEKEQDYLTNFDRQESNFNGLPKVHKSEQINKACSKANKSNIKIIAPNNLNFRPIVVGTANETHRLSNCLDILLKHLTKFVKSYIKDSTDFLNKSPKDNPKHSLLVYFDVENIKTNIPRDFGLDAIKCWLDKHRTEIPTRISQTFVLKALDFILKNNIFLFNDKI